MKLSSLASWWPLVAAVADYAEEAEVYWRIMAEHAKRSIETKPEMGRRSRSERRGQALVVLCKLLRAGAGETSL